MRVAVVGAGVTGSVAAVQLARSGAAVTVFDIGKRAPGGRTASRPGKHAEVAWVDIGAQAISLGPNTSPKFAAMLTSWQASGWVRPWQGRFGCLTPSGFVDSHTPPAPGVAARPDSQFFGCMPAHSVSPSAPSPTLGDSHTLLVACPSMAGLTTQLLGSHPRISLRLGTRVAHAHLHACPTPGPPSNPSLSPRTSLALTPPPPAAGASPQAAEPAAAAAQPGVQAESQSVGSRGRQAVWRLGALQPGDLGEFDVLLVTDVMTARLGSPGYCAISADPELVATALPKTDSPGPSLPPAPQAAQPPGLSSRQGPPPQSCTVPGLSEAAAPLHAAAPAQAGDAIATGDSRSPAGCAQLGQTAGEPRPSMQQALERVMGSMAALRRVPLFTLFATFQGTSSPLLPLDAATLPRSSESTWQPGFAWLALDSSKPGRSTAASQAAGVQTLVAITTPDFAHALLTWPDSASTPPAHTHPPSTLSPGSQAALKALAARPGLQQPGPEAAPRSLAGEGHVEVPLPPQTPEYLEVRAKAMWQQLQQVLSDTPGCSPLPDPLQLTAHRWGAAHTDSHLELPCVPLSLAHAEAASAPSSTTGCGNSGVAALPSQVAMPPTYFVAAGDFCQWGQGANTGRIEDAACSGLAAAEAILGLEA